jgi:hypothetical protein
MERVEGLKPQRGDKITIGWIHFVKVDTTDEIALTHTTSNLAEFEK